MCGICAHMLLKNSWEWRISPPTLKQVLTMNTLEIAISGSEKLNFLSISKSICVLCGRQELNELLLFFPSTFQFSSWGQAWGSLTSGPGSQPGRPSPRAMAPLQSQLCNWAPWLWRNLEEHKVSFVNPWKLWQMFWAFHQAFWLLYEVSMAPQSTFSNTDFGALRRERQEITYVLHEKKNHLFRNG